MNELARALFFLLLVTPAYAAEGPDWLVSSDVYLSVSSFSWEERFAGQTILREKGPLFAVGGSGVIDLYRRNLLLKINGEVFGASVDYDGVTQTDPSHAIHSACMVKTEVSYIGTKLDTDLGWRLPLGSFSAEPFVGVGYRWWLRDLRDTTAIDNAGAPFHVNGYTEWWQTAYARLGARGSLKLSRRSSLFCEGGAKFPFYTSNSIDFENIGMTVLEPKGKPTGFAEAGLVYGRLLVSMTYEGFRFSQSSPVAAGGKNYLQPDSSSDILGVKVGWTFR